MAKQKVTITLDEETVAAVDKLAGGPGGNRSAFIEAAVTERLQRTERALRAVDWLAGRARQDHPGEWDAAVEAVTAADARRGFETVPPADPGQAA
ncbi:ribbon-helix-helix domain-containing protein [Streptomyces sp. NPDC001070]